MNVRKLLVYPLLIIFAINPAHAAIRLQHAGDDSKFINISKSGEENVVFQYCEGEEDCRQMGPLESYPLASLEEVRTCNESENDLFPRRPFRGNSRPFHSLWNFRSIRRLEGQR